MTTQDTKSETKEGYLTLFDIFEKAAKHKGLELTRNQEKAYSKPIEVYTLDKESLAFLAEKRIKRQERPEHHKIFTLVDQNPQEERKGWEPSNYWNFNIDEEGHYDLQIKLYVGFGFNIKKRGIVFLPRASGGFLSPYDRLPNLRMFKALAEIDKKPPSVVKEIAQSEEGCIVVTWTDIGLGGIRSISELFDEFARDNETIRDVARNEEIFDPPPSTKFEFRQPGERLFITEPTQPEVFQAWQEQLEKFRSRLVA